MFIQLASQRNSLCGNRLFAPFEVLFNIIGNALKFTPEGGTVTVDCWCVESPKDVRGNRSSLCISVKVPAGPEGVVRVRALTVVRCSSEWSPRDTGNTYSCPSCSRGLPPDALR